VHTAFCVSAHQQFGDLYALVSCDFAVAEYRVGNGFGELHTGT